MGQKDLPRDRVAAATTAQYILIQNTNTNYLQLAEVQVIGK